MANKNTHSNASGRPTKYKAEYVKIAKKMCELGATDADIIEAIGVARSTFYKWRAEHKAFSDALKVGKAPSDDRVEATLYQKAVGYTQQSVKIFQFQGEEVVVPYTEIVPPDTTAAIFWLKNRRPEQWRAQPELDPKEREPVTIQIVNPNATD